LSFLIDTNVVIHLRDGDEGVSRKMADLDALPVIAMITRIELENGLYRDPELTDLLRPNLAVILRRTDVIDFGNMEFEAYRSILDQVGFSKRKVLDRMIAATALAHNLTLITMNGKDFRDVPGLKLVEWETPEG
jgi:predicted nucleic acid-binding protein